MKVGGRLEYVYTEALVSFLEGYGGLLSFEQRKVGRNATAGTAGHRQMESCNSRHLFTSRAAAFWQLLKHSQIPQDFGIFKRKVYGVYLPSLVSIRNELREFYRTDICSCNSGTAIVVNTTTQYSVGNPAARTMHVYHD